MPQQNITYTGEWEKFVVPNGVKVLTLTVRGGGAGTVAAGEVVGKVRVDPKDVLWIQVGQSGRTRSGTGNRTGGDTAYGGGGRGGDGTDSGLGGNGGGGATQVRKNTRDGRIVVVAGGAGGASGDGALGGKGGARVGEIGAVSAVLPGEGVAEAATGGTQSQSGQGGTSSIGTAIWGRPGQDEKLGRGGRGGSDTTAGDVQGGGGGGGGFYPGGGGAGGRHGIAPATGGAGGSNFTGGLYTSTNTQGTGGTGHGSVLIEWVDPNDLPPVPPDNIVIDGQPISNGLATKAKNWVLLKGTPDDPDTENGLRLYVKVSQDPSFPRHRVFRGTYNEAEARDHVRIDGLSQDTRYYLRIHTQARDGDLSINYKTTNFWTNRSPNPPTLTGPDENAQFTSLVNVTFQWNHTDPDPSDSQTAFRLRYRTAETPAVEAGAWTVVEEITSFQQWTVAAGSFAGNTLYEWQLKTRDEQERWGEWSEVRSFYVIGQATPPVLLYPIKLESFPVNAPLTFQWRFRTPTPGVLQVRADLRYRPITSLAEEELGDWTVVAGDITTPGGDWFWEFAADFFAANTGYQWQVRTYGAGDTEPSDWSETGVMLGAPGPETGPGTDPVASGLPQHPLGIGTNRVFIYDRGGSVMRGEITGTTLIRWGRKRDDIGEATVTLKNWSEATLSLLRTVRTWRHEIVVFRDGVRVFEGPVTLVGGNRSVGITLQAKDVMGYVYRRIMRQGYDDSYRIMNGQQLGQSTVVERAQRIITNALAYDDPNVLPYLTPVTAADDARNSRIVKDYSRTAWEEIDDLAATAGLDYATSGRRILLWDTHRPLGRLAEMGNGAFSEEPIITEYGMSAANYFGVTNNDGVYGVASALIDGEPLPPEGWIEQLASAYSESEADAIARTLTRADRLKLEETLTEQAERNIEGRWFPPVIVRVPDNSTLSPDLNVGINQLVPGVWIPLRADNGIREVSQWQKLDSITVEQTDKGEKISVIMSPAPNGGQDPDADLAIEETP